MCTATRLPLSQPVYARAQSKVPPPDDVTLNEASKLVDIQRTCFLLVHIRSFLCCRLPLLQPVNARAQSKVPPPDDVNLNETLDPSAWTALQSAPDHQSVFQPDLSRLSFTAAAPSVTDLSSRTYAEDGGRNDGDDPGYDSFLDGNKAGTSANGSVRDDSRQHRRRKHHRRYRDDAAAAADSSSPSAIGGGGSDFNSGGGGGGREADVGAPDPFYLGARQGGKTAAAAAAALGQAHFDASGAAIAGSSAENLEGDEDYAGAASSRRRGDKKRGRRKKAC